MKIDGLQRLLDFLSLLSDHGVEYKIGQQGPDEIMVTFALVGIRAEATFDVEGMHYCLFKGSESVVSDQAALVALIKERSQ